jgi:hypothetical protein
MRKSGLADSPFFTPLSSPMQAENSGLQKSERPSERTEKRTVYRAENRSESLPTKRRTKRYSFEFYQDQLDTLKRLKARCAQSGEQITLSEIVRHALDRYLRDQQL